MSRKDHISLQIALPESLFVAADGTLLIAADSFVSPIPIHRDPSSESAFRFVVDVICSGLCLELPHPGQAHDGDQSPLFGVWTREGIHRRVEQAVSPRLLEVARDIEGVFLTLVRMNQSHFSRWMSHQLNRANFEQYRGGRNSFEILSGCTERLISALSDKSLTIEHFDSLTVDQCDLDVVLEMKQLSNKMLVDDRVIALAYAFHTAIKGPAYASQLVQSGSNALYRTHWIRDGILTHGGLTKAVSASQSARIFPWGSVLTALVKRYRRELTSEPQVLSEIILSIRDFHKKSFNRLSSDSIDETRRYIQDALAIAEVRKVILSRSGVEQYAQENAKQRFRQIGSQQLKFAASSLRISDSLRIGSFNLESKHKWGNLLNFPRDVNTATQETDLEKDIAVAVEETTRKRHSLQIAFEQDALHSSKPCFSAFYNTSDFREVESLVLGLCQRQYSPFFYPKDQDPLRPTLDQIEDAIKISPVNLFFVGKHGVGSFQLREADFAAEWNDATPKKNLVVIMESYEGKVSLPPPLALMEYIDIRYSSGQFWSNLVSAISRSQLDSGSN